MSDFHWTHQRKQQASCLCFKVGEIETKDLDNSTSSKCKISIKDAVLWEPVMSDNRV